MNHRKVKKLIRLAKSNSKKISRIPFIRVDSYHIAPVAGIYNGVPYHYTCGSLNRNIRRMKMRHIKFAAINHQCTFSPEEIDIILNKYRDICPTFFTKHKEIK